MRSAAALLTVAIALSSCSGDDAATTTTPAATTVTAPRGTMALPPEFPDAVPIPADLELEEANRMTGTTSELFELTGWHDGEPVVAGLAYLATVEAAGFTVTSRSETPTNLFFTAEGAAWAVSAGFYPDPVRNAGTSVGVTVSPITTSTN
jgi:hypothetical protein